MEKKYVISFFLSIVFLTLTVLFFVTWMNPDRVTNMSWSIDLITDRNIAYKKFYILKNKTDYSDLIVGSSTSETLLPEVIEKLYNIKAQNAGTGGAKTPFRYSEINYALKNNPNLKRILYFIDMFEFVDTNLGPSQFYQQDIMNEIDSDLRVQLAPPSITAIIPLYFSEPTLKSTYQTFLDYRKFKNGHYKSILNPDGTTSGSLVIVNRKEPIGPRAIRIANSYDSLYKNLKTLNPLTIQFFHRVIEKTKAHNVEVVFVITPWHTLFYKHFETDLKKHNDIYKKYVEFVKTLRSDSVRVIDYSYPLSLEKGIPDEGEYWGDGIHFGVKSAKIILDEIYKKKEAL